MRLICMPEITKFNTIEPKEHLKLSDGSSINVSGAMGNILEHNLIYMYHTLVSEQMIGKMVPLLEIILFTKQLIKELFIKGLTLLKTICF